MKSSILYIGIIDHDNTPHFVRFEEGVNVITGRSSTGKSALIEIFDYCFGSSDFTVPVGVITENAKLYFTVMKMEKSILVLGRAGESDHVFLKEELETETFDSIDWLSDKYFDRDYILPLRDYLKRMNRYFGITVTDIDEDFENRMYRGGRKASTPSIRSFSSFMLQHQNLVANKHAIFYRFDQKEKREQAIDHLKIFLGFADQRYFSLKQQLNELDAARRRIIREIPRKKENESRFQSKLEQAIFAFDGITGKKAGMDIAAAIAAPANELKRFQAVKLRYVASSNEHVKLLNEADAKQAELSAKLRTLQTTAAEISSTIDFSEKYAARNRNVEVPRTANIAHANCPFCLSENNSVENSANTLSDAIGWLNTELKRSSYRQRALNEDEAAIKKDIAAVRSELATVMAKIRNIRKQTQDMSTIKNQYELSVEAKMRVEGVLAELVSAKLVASDSELAKLEGDIKKIVLELKANYNLEAKIGAAEARIHQLLKIYGDRFDFERSYNPINLHFSLESFDLWHETEDEKKVFLRAMGSGANWLSCHLVLFLSLQRYFCEVGDGCAIPSVLFFDQPSQVYFPTILDSDAEFSPVELAARDKTRTQNRPVDEDIVAVTNLFDQMVLYCSETKKLTGTMPQIIVTDHADKLKLKDGIDFESLVRKRWRDAGDGFIDLRGLTA